MAIIKTQLTGISPLLLHSGTIVEKSMSKKGQDYSDEWKKTVYIGMDGLHLVIPSMNLDAMLRDAGKGRNIGKQFFSKIIPVNVSVEEFESPILVEGEKVTVDDVETNDWLFTCATVIQKKRVMRTRARMPIGWQINFTINLNDDCVIKPNILREVLTSAGGLPKSRSCSQKSPSPTRL